MIMKTLKRVKIEVLAKDIRLGKRNHSKTCAISRAAKRQFKGKDISTRYVSMSVGEWTYNLPKKASNFISRFDMGKKVKPFSFTMRLSSTIK